MTVRGVTLGIALGLAAAGCSDGGGATAARTTTTSSTATTTTAPERPASTTTTAFDPTSIEGAVEAAYLRSWDVYADAAYSLELDEQALAEVYAEDGLVTVVDEIRGRLEGRRATLVSVEHRYRIAFTNDALASVIDELINHQVLIDPDSKEPIEEDPNEPQLLNFVMKKIDGDWFVTLIQRVAG